ncbi:dihydrodipicolinate synthase family protein [Scleromatobacter humisilvae]|uniref:4-hydroxy-tetrahydrodipicolinate synthase n=1 Tax=Scleromatobacter humisilvae TaxID=2897159 RepID=A0A9X2BXJ4_9BURK|nr:dihydrodipicolinate synthase family protein [Scleromatobacter humisilvae]MCK9684482.1 dihydrodipicolinate synthase family protein [Scleromatobacter humisilvae]
MSRTIDFSGVWIPIVTPFRDRRVDHEALAALVRRLAADGVAGFVVCATTGEAPLLADDERVAVLGTVKANTSLPLVMGASGTTADEVLRRIDAAARHAPAAFMVTAPPYLRPSQDALRAFFTTIADAAPAPLVVYDIPARTGVRIELATLLALAAHTNVVALKDCGGRVEQTEALIADGRLQVLCGNDNEWFSTRCLGGAGAIAASAHVRTDLFVAFDAALARGDLATGRTLWRQLKPLTAGLFEEPSPGPVKALLAARGECANELRAPMTTASTALTERLLTLVACLPANG